MPRALKVLIGLLLLPPCIGAVAALARVLAVSGRATHFWVAAAGGAACWLSVYVLLPRPTWMYVFGHELTHALWTWLFGGRVKRFRVGSRGGHVVVTRSNSLIALAPYFFPVYVAIVAAVYAAGHLVWGWSQHAVWFHLLLGAAYGFHVTLTWQALETEQSDITGQGFFFSAVVIVLGNLIVLLLAIPLLTGVGVSHALTWWMRDTGGVLQRLAGLIS
jgi:hypothetical protein